MNLANTASKTFLTLCLLSFLASGCGAKKTVLESDRYTALGTVMAQKTTELCGGKGDIVLLVNVADDNNETAFGKTQTAFRQALNQSIRITATERLSLPSPMPGLDPLSPAQFRDLLQKYSTVAAIVTFVGVPNLSPEEISQLPSSRPKVVAVVTYGSPRKSLFARGLLQLAAIAKPTLDQNTLNSGAAQEIFDAHYQLITPDTAGKILP
jgi:hypothetical protein